MPDVDVVLKEVGIVSGEIEETRRALGSHNAAIRRIQKQYERKLRKLQKRYMRKIQLLRLEL